MVTFQMMQFTAAVFMTALTMKLLMLSGRHQANKGAANSRWLMVSGTLTLALHFALQLALGLRQMGVTQAVMLNLAMFIPTTFFFAWAILLLQRRGQLSRTDWLVGPITWIVVMAMLGAAATTDGQPLLSGTPELRHAEIAGAAVYVLMQCYYVTREAMNLIAMRRALQDYYDKENHHILTWMKLSIILLMMLSMMVPLVIFGSGKGLLLVSFIIYFAIFYFVDSFCSYLNSSAPARILEAEVNADEVEQEIVGEKDVAPTGGEGGHLTDEAMQAIDKAVAAWTARGEHCRTGLLLPLAAAGIGVPKYRLTCWLHQKGLKYTDWIAALRVEEAKRTIKAHPDWQNEAVAEHCGFTERTLLRTFKKLTGMTLAQYADHGA
jgi:hypothetical protein